MPLQLQSLPMPHHNGGVQMSGQQAGAAVSLPNLMGITPFGICCQACQCSVGLSIRSIQQHVETKHSSAVPGEDIITWKAVADKEKERLIENGNISQHLVCQHDGFICACGPLSLTKAISTVTAKWGSPASATQRMLGWRCSSKLSVAAGFPSLQSSPWHQRFPQPQTLMSPKKLFQSAFALMSRLTSVSPRKFHPLVEKAQGDFDSLIGDVVSWWSSPVEGEGSLPDILNAAKEWITTRARNEVSMLPGNHRVALMVFEGQDVAEVSQNTTCNF